LPYKAALTKNFLRELKKLPENVRKRVLTAIDELIRNPFSGVRLRGELRGKWRRRVGKYRVVYRIDYVIQQFTDNLALPANQG